MRRARPPLPLLAAVAAVALLALAHTGEIRARAETGLGAGMPKREAALARGFVLGDDASIDPRTVEDFRRSGLSHLLAVSGQNVALLALLAMPLLAALGISLRLRLAWVLALIAVYVPLAGAGPSILRAGVMGALSIAATFVGRRSSRLHALAVAAGVTLAIDPTLGADVGWQLSFAAVLGIILMAGPLRRRIGARLGRRGLGGALADGAAMTIAATVATAPLIAFHFEGVSTTTLAANLLALPAVAPAMWLGMLAAAVGQVPGVPTEPLNAVNAPLLAYIAEVAAWTGRPRWAYLELEVGGAELLLAYATILAAVLLGPRIARARRLAALRRAMPRRSLRGARLAPVAVCVATALLGLAAIRPAAGGVEPPPAGSLRVSVLDVGQGDAILLQPGRRDPLLIDTGPPGADLLARLERAGVSRLGAVILTHDQLDHAGGLDEVVGSLPVGSVLHAALDRRTAGKLRAAGAPMRRLGAGSALSSGRLRLEVLWPPAHPPTTGDPNHGSLVIEASWGGFSILLCGDAEAESVPIEPGPIDVLKVAHHGSEDAGLPALLARSDPELAVISVGEGNPHGHPAPATLGALAAHGTPTLRTDRDGTVTIDVAGDTAQIATEG